MPAELIHYNRELGKEHNCAVALTSAYEGCDDAVSIVASLKPGAGRALWEHEHELKAFREMAEVCAWRGCCAGQRGMAGWLHTSIVAGGQGYCLEGAHQVGRIHAHTHTRARTHAPRRTPWLQVSYLVLTNSSGAREPGFVDAVPHHIRRHIDAWRDLPVGSQPTLLSTQGLFGLPDFIDGYVSGWCVVCGVCTQPRAAHVSAHASLPTRAYPALRHLHGMPPVTEAGAPSTHNARMRGHTQSGQDTGAEGCNELDAWLLQAWWQAEQGACACACKSKGAGGPSRTLGWLPATQGRCPCMGSRGLRSAELQLVAPVPSLVRRRAESG